MSIVAYPGKHHHADRRISATKLSLILANVALWVGMAVGLWMVAR